MKSKVFIVASHTAQSNARTGIQTVVRGLYRGIASLAPAVPLAWNARRKYLHTLKASWLAHLAVDEPPPKLFLPIESLLQPRFWRAWLISSGRDFRTPLHLHPCHADDMHGAWLLLPELMDPTPANLAIEYAKTHGMKIAAIFYDAIPLSHPDFSERTLEVHAAYMQALGKADVVLPISQDSAKAFIHFLQQEGCGSPTVIPCPLPAEILGSPRATALKLRDSIPVNILCVSTLEPRKNHLRLIAAFEQLRGRFPDVELHLVGDRYIGSPEIAEAVLAAAKRDSAIRWHGNVSHGRLRELFEACDFTIYPTVLEGFGLPIMESLWQARPCICSNTGVMAENAEGGGCLTVDVSDVDELSGAMLALVSNGELRANLARETTSRKLLTWREYAADVYSKLR